jgi:Arc/MetJ-type ribon-helix-helix transcriptional regulator
MILHRSQAGGSGLTAAWLVAAAVLWAIVVAVPARGQTGADDLDKQICRLMQEACVSQTLDEANKKLDEAIKLHEQFAETSGNLYRKNILQAEIWRTRGRIQSIYWQHDSSNQKLRESSITTLKQALALYERVQVTCEKQADVLMKRLDEAALAGNAQWRMLDSTASHCSYAIAWCNYRLGLLTEGDPAQSGYFNKAIANFQQFTAEGYRQHPIISQCFLGQALCYYEVDKHYEIKELLKEITPDNCPPDTYKLITLCRLRAFRAIPSPMEITRASRQYFSKIDPKQRLDTIELGILMQEAWALAQLADPQQNPRYHAQFKTQLDAVVAAIYPYGQPWRHDLAKLLKQQTEDSPFVALDIAKQLFNKGEYEKASDVARKALAKVTDEADSVIVADLRYLVTGAAWNRQQWSQAHAMAVAFARHHPQDKRHRKACAMILQAALKSLKTDHPVDDDAIQAGIQLVQQYHPDLPDLQAYRWMQADRLLKNKQYAPAITLLSPIRASSTIYLKAQYGLALASYRLADEKQDQRAALLKQSAQAVGRFIDAAPEQLDEKDKPLIPVVVNIAVAVSQKLAQGNKEEGQAAVKLLDQLDGWDAAGALAVGHRQALRTQLLFTIGQTDKALQAVEQLIQRTDHNAHTMRALAAAADPMERLYDRFIQAQQTDQAAAQLDRMITLYRVMLDHVQAGQDPQLTGQRIALVRRLAQCHSRRGEYGKAIGYLSTLAKQLPPQQSGDVLRELADTYEKTRQYDKAAETWRVLTRGLPRGENHWFEARYHLILCYHLGGQGDLAKKLMDLHALQYPNQADGDWHKRFERLAQTLKSDQP